MLSLTLLSHRYKEVLIGLKGSKSILTFFSFPSSVTIVPQYITRPFGLTTKQKDDEKSTKTVGDVKNM